MNKFANGREAKEFLADRIVGESLRSNVPLSETERKMLYFSETAWTLPDIADVNAAFDVECDPEKYEQKIAKLIRKFRADARASNKGEFEAWTEAVRTLRKEDHYLLVMIDAAGETRPRGDFLKLLATALVIVSALVAIVFLVANR